MATTLSLFQSYIRQGLFCFKYGDPNCLVEFIHVDNVVLAHCLAAEGLSCGSSSPVVSVLLVCTIEISM